MTVEVVKHAQTQIVNVKVIIDGMGSVVLVSYFLVVTPTLLMTNTATGNKIRERLKSYKLQLLQLQWRSKEFNS